MFENHVYNLLAQLNQEHKSLWRIKEMYKDDVDDCEECTAFWGRMEEDKEEHIAELTALIKQHLD